MALPPNVRALPPVQTRMEVRLRHRVGALEIDVDFKLDQRWTVLFGPSGSGKTTILRAIAGLIRPDQARIVATGSGGSGLEHASVLVDTGDGIFLPAHKREVRLAPQHATLFPHYTVLENMKYGMHLTVRDRKEQEARDKRIEGLLADFEIAHLEEMYPATLSGGEAQRVNLARAVATGGGRLLMLDEPFAGIDVALRDGLIARLKERLQLGQARQILSVTHDVAEAFQLGAEVIKFAEGKVVAQGPVEEVLAEERARLLRQLG